MKQGGRFLERRLADTIVGLDVGTTSVKAVAINEDGAVVSRATAGYPLATPRSGWAEQDPEDWWGATQRVLGAIGGENLAPSPTAYLLGALAGCGVVFLRDTLAPQFDVTIDALEATARCRADAAPRLPGHWSRTRLP